PDLTRGGPRFSEKHVLGLDPRDHAPTITRARRRLEASRLALALAGGNTLIRGVRGALPAMIATMALATGAGAFDLQGHRGARALLPENTIPAFTKALAIGVTTLELDMALTKDGVLVVHHDETLNPDIARGPDGTFLTARGPALRALTLAEVKRYDVGRIKPGTAYAARFSQQQPVDGTRIPTLEEVFDLVRRAGADHIRFNVETKITPTSGDDVASPEIFAEAVAQAIDKAGLTAWPT